MIRLGLCCQFAEQPIKFSNTTVTACARLTTKEREAKLADLCRQNATTLMKAFEFCVANGIGNFRVLSPILPVVTHEKVGYELRSLPDGIEIQQQFEACGNYAKANNLRTAFHPDQFVVLNSPKPEVVDRSIAELEYQSEVAEWVNADVVNIHGGGAYGDKVSALAAFRQNFKRLSKRVRERLTVENDDKTYTPEDLLPLCEDLGVPLIYDVHHHRCLPDELSVKTATERAIQTWNREPMFHISSPLEGWNGPKPNRHHDYINPTDFPDEWLGLDITIEVEAKAKELAVLKLQRHLNQNSN